MSTGIPRANRGRAQKSAPEAQIMKRSYKPIPSTRYLFAGSLSLLVGMLLIIGAMSYVNSFDDRPVTTATTLDDPFNWAVPGYQPGGLNQKVESHPKALGEPPKSVGSPKTSNFKGYQPVSAGFKPDEHVWKQGFSFSPPANFSSSSGFRALTAHFNSFSPVSSTGPSSKRTPLVMLVGSNLRWDQFDPSSLPSIFTEFDQFTAANMVVRTQGPNTCPISGFLTINAGARIGAAGICPDFTPYTSSGISDETRRPRDYRQVWKVQNWEQSLTYAARLGQEDRLSTLALALKDAGKKTFILGSDPAAALTLPNAEVLGRIQDPRQYSGATPKLAASIIMDSISGVDFAIIDLTELTKSLLNTQVATPESQLKLAHALLWPLQERQANVILTSVSDISNSSTEHSLKNARQQLFAAWGPSFPKGLAYSNSVRRPALIQTTDLHHGIIELLQLKQNSSPSSLGTVSLGTVRSEADSSTFLTLTTQPRRAVGVIQAQLPFILTLCILLVLAFPAAAWSLYRPIANRFANRKVKTASTEQTWPKPKRLLWFWKIAGTWLSFLVPCTFAAGLTSWWKLVPGPTDSHLPALTTVAYLTPFFLATALSVAFFATPWLRNRNPLLIVSLLTLVMAFFDPIFGSWLMMDSLLGTQTLVGGRFYGVDNLLYALLATSSLLFATYISSRLNFLSLPRIGLFLTVGVGLAAVVVDGLPSIGADFGGPLPLFIGFSILIAHLSQSRWPWLIFMLSATLGTALVSVLALIDWTRPPMSRTHLGNAVDSVLQGKLGQIIVSKSTQLWTAGWSLWAIILAFIVVLIVICVTAWPLWVDMRNPYALGYAWLHGKPDINAHPPLRHLSPTWRAFAIAWICTMVTAAPINDSSVLIILVGIALLGPMIIAASCHYYLSEPNTKSLV